MGFVASLERPSAGRSTSSLEAYSAAVDVFVFAIAAFLGSKCLSIGYFLSV